MPTRNDDLWQNFNSEFFMDATPDETFSETIPSTEIRSTVADNRQILNILFIIDVSGSMRGQRIATVNTAMENIVQELRRRDDMNAIIKINIMEFCEQAQWVMNQPIPINDYDFTRLQVQPWITNYAPAFDLLNEKLSRKAFMNPDLGEYFAPLILFISDGEPTDPTEFPNALTRLSKNGWFKKSSKYAIAVGEEAKSQDVIRVLTMFAEDEKHVRYADEGEALCSLIEYVAIRASEVQTTMSSTVNSSDKKQTDWSEIFDGKDQNLFSSMFDS